MRIAGREKKMRLHFVGIGGIGMSGIAQVFLKQGYSVSGSDLSDSDATRVLREMGATVWIGHEASRVTGADVVVISSAVKSGNPELIEAKRLRIPVIPRAEMLGELMRGKTGIAVAGTHGKTTTTSMLASILTLAELDPTLVIGGKVDALGGNAKYGQGQFVLAEADESDGSFLHLPATYGVITNIDADHLDHFEDQQEIDDAFSEFVAKLPFYGLAAVCWEDEGVRRCLPDWTKPYVTYGFHEQCDWRALELEAGPSGYSFSVIRRGDEKSLGRIRLRVPGKHNVLNAMAAITIALELEIEFGRIAEALGSFGGVRRRFEIRWHDPGRKMAIIDDYAHHPTEILATLAAAREYWKGRVITVFQPHRYSRTLHCKEGFLSAFSQTDKLLLTDVYSAGEDPIEEASSARLASEMNLADVEYTGDLGKTRNRALEIFQEGDLLLCLGAGSVTKLADQLCEAQGEKLV